MKQACRRGLCARLRAVVLRAVVAVGISYASIAAFAQSPGPVVVPAPVNTDQSYGDLGQRLVIFLLGKPALLSTADIDELVGNPWQLSPATSSKLATLRPRLRMEVYQFAAGNLSSFQFVPDAGANAASTNGLSSDGFSWPTSLTPVAGQQLSRNLLTTAVQHFRPEELADLGVYSVSTQAFFPKDSQNWTRWKRAIVRDDVLLGSAAALALATTDQIQARVSGMLVSLPGQRFRLGWFTDFADFGFKLQPTLHTGFKVKSPEVEVSAALVERFGAGNSAEIRAAEVIINNHWLQRVAAPRGWELALTATGRYVLATRTAVPQSAVQTAADLYFRRAGFAESAALSLLVRTHFATDYRNQFSAASAVGVEHNRFDFVALVRVGMALDRDAGTRDASVGLVLAASLEPRLDHLRAAMFGSADAVTVRVQNLAMIQGKIVKAQHALSRAAAVQKADEEADLHLWQLHLQQGRTDLVAELDGYVADRNAFYRHAGKPWTTMEQLVTTEHGPLLAASFAAALQEIARLP